MKRKLVVLLLVVAALPFTLMGPQIVNHSPVAKQPPTLCQWMPWLPLVCN